MKNDVAWVPMYPRGQIMYKWIEEKKLGWSDHNLGTHEPAKILSNVQFTFINTRYLVRLYMIREYIPGFIEDPNAISMLKVAHQEV